MYYYTAPKPLGILVYDLDLSGGISSIIFQDTIPHTASLAPDKIQKAFDVYFEKKKNFPLDLLSQDLKGTDFQRTVWRVIAEVPFGETITYSELALRAGKPGAARAAGTACGKNPIALAIPCHRVVRSSGEDYGYSWGFARKKWLLEFEGVQI